MDHYASSFIGKVAPTWFDRREKLAGIFEIATISAIAQKKIWLLSVLTSNGYVVIAENIKKQPLVDWCYEVYAELDLSTIESFHALVVSDMLLDKVLHRNEFADILC